jgi:hypothetical protein
LLGDAGAREQVVLRPAMRDLDRAEQRSKPPGEFPVE